MKTSKLIPVALIVAAMAVVLCFSKCQKDPATASGSEAVADPGDAPPTTNTYPSVTLLPASNLTSNSILIEATFSLPKGASPVTDHGLMMGGEYLGFTNGTNYSYGPGTAPVSRTFTGLTEDSAYFFGAYAVNSAGLRMDMNEIWSPTEGSVSNCGGTTMTDPRDGKVYRITQIGNQCWMADNLNVGTMITGGPGVHADSSNDIIEKFCYANKASNCAIYGGLYQWKELLQGCDSSSTNPSGVRGICPEGWHIPSFSEISQLSMFIGGSESGYKLKEVGTTHWTKGNGGATNEFGFNSIGGGIYQPESGSFSGLKERGFYWSSTPWWSHNRYNQSFYFGHYATVNWQYHFSFMKTNAHSVRCVKDPDAQ